jgi:putative ABC transport system permease protein
VNWWQRLFGRRRLENELSAELRFHFDEQVADNLRAGMTEEEARRAARREFGGVEQVAEECRDARGTLWVETTLRDLRQAVRVLSRSPKFTAIAVLTLALGIGANTAIFSVVKAVLINQLPYRDPDRVVAVFQSGTANGAIDYATLNEWKTQTRSLQSISIRRDCQAVIDDNGIPTVIRGLRVSHDFFDTLGVRMLLGRSFRPEEELPDRDWEMILTHSAWVQHFGSDPNAVGRVVYSQQHGHGFTVVGVLPANFRPLRMSNPGESPEYFAPLGEDVSRFSTCRRCDAQPAIARLKPGVPPAQAQAELNARMRKLVREYPNDYARGTFITVMPLRDQLVGRMSTALRVVWGAAGLILLIACANLANLFLARSAARAREIALRAALGGSRWRLVRQLLTETLLVALVGGAAGALVAWAGVSALRSSAPPELPRMEEIRMDPSILLFALLVSAGTGILFGIAPALRASRVDLTDALKHSGDRRYARPVLRNLLVVAELALAFVLVVGTGLLSKSFLRLIRLDPGYNPHHVLTCTVLCYGPRYETYEQRLGFYRQVTAKVRAIPGVEDAGMANTIPLSQPTQTALTIRERPLPNAAEAPNVDSYIVTPDYFRVMRIPLQRGRMFTEQDHLQTAAVALVSESCARVQFGGEDPVGRHIRLGTDRDSEPWITVVGIVGDVRQHGMDHGSDSGVYMPQAQQESWVRMVIRTKGDPSALVPAVRAAVHDIDATQAVWHFQPMDAWVAASLADRRLTLALIGLFGSLALTLAAVGVYGVVSYTASLRTREVGICMALGAQPRAIVIMMLRDVSVMLGWGLAGGLLAALALTRLLAHLLYQVQPTDLETLAAVAVALTAVALTAGYLPARRAAGVDPTRALRCE